MVNRLQRVACVGMLICTQAVLGTSLRADDTTPATPGKELPTKEEVLSPENVSRLSEAYGHLIYKSLSNPFLRLDFAGVVKGLTDAKEGRPSPMNEQQYEEAVAAVQELSSREMSAKNLAEAEAFLAKNAKEPGVVELDKGKVQILVIQKGSGEEVTESVLPVIHYTGRYINGTVFGSSRESKEPLSINLKHTIPGFRMGILGMKVGERRTIFIHPDAGYGTSGQLLPNALLIFDVEVVKLDPMPKKDVQMEVSAEDEDGVDGDDDGASTGDDDSSDDGDDDGASTSDDESSDDGDDNGSDEEE